MQVPPGLGNISSSGASAGFRDRHGRGGREIRGLTVEQHIARLREDLIPLAERCARVMREALASLETLGAARTTRLNDRSRSASLYKMLKGSSGCYRPYKPSTRVCRTSRSDPIRCLPVPRARTTASQASLTAPGALRTPNSQTLRPVRRLDHTGDLSAGFDLDLAVGDRA